MNYSGISGVPDFTCEEFLERRGDACLLIPVINEGERLFCELGRAEAAGVDRLCDIVILDGGSTDGCVESGALRELGVGALLVKTGPGRQGAQLRMGFWWALERGYKFILTVDGNDKDGIEDAGRILEKLRQGYDFVQGSRFVPGGVADNTPLVRFLSVRLLHAPVISLAAGKRFTDTTNNFRGYSRRYLTHPGLEPFRDVFSGYELLAYLSIRASRLGLKACEVPVRRSYPAGQKTPTKISPLKGCCELLAVLFKAAFSKYNP